MIQRRCNNSISIQIEKETKRLEMIVADLLKLSRLSMSTLALELSPCEISELFDSRLRRLRPRQKVRV